MGTIRRLPKMSLHKIYLCELADGDLFSRFLEVNACDACKSLGRLLLFCARALADGRDDDPLLPSSSRRDPARPGCFDGTSPNAALPEAEDGTLPCGGRSAEGGA
ncbi:hypothetical protein ACLOJK_000094 [Asimina triloba]